MDKLSIVFFCVFICLLHFVKFSSPYNLWAGKKNYKRGTLLYFDDEN